MFILLDNETELFKVEDIEVAKFYAKKFNLKIKDEPYKNS